MKKGRFLLLNCFIALLFGVALIVVFVLGINKGLQRSDYSYEYEHYVLQSNGYQYCPYCGEELKEIGQKVRNK